MDPFTDWNARFPRGEGTEHQTGPLTPDSVFMFQSVTAPRPSAAHWGVWNWYENALQLRAHLLFVVFPDLAATWLSEGSLGLQTMRQPLTVTVADALPEWGEDKQFFETMAHDLEVAVGSSNRALAADLQRIAHTFTERFGQTPTWDMRLEVFTNIEEAAANLYDRDSGGITGVDGQDITREEWFSLCQEASVNKEVSSHVETTFRDAFEF